jgi:hypothetical protein
MEEVCDVSVESKKREAKELRCFVHDIEMLERILVIKLFINNLV